VPKKQRSEKRKAYQQAAYAAAKKTHEQKRAAQNGRAAANIKLQREGKLTPWQEVKALRHARRAAVRASLPSGGQSLCRISCG
jgi:hypothetical protein